MITIRNKRTGETKQVKETELGGYGLVSGGQMPTPSPTPTPMSPPGNVALRSDIAGQAIPQSTGPIMGGNIPKITGGVGGLLGGLIASPGIVTTPLGAAGGYAAGYGGGKVIENTLEDLLGQQKENQLEQVTTAAKETATGAATEGLLTALFMGLGSLAKKALTGAGNLWVRSALKETPKQVAETTAKKATQEAMERAGKEVTQRPAEELSEFVLKTPNLKGGAQELATRATGQLMRDPGTALSTVDDLIANIPTAPPTKQIFDAAVEKSIKGLPLSERAAAQTMADDLMEGMLQDGGHTWRNLIDFRMGLDDIARGKEGTEFANISRKLTANLADEIRGATYEVGGEPMKAAYGALEGYIRTLDAAKRAQSRNVISTGGGLLNNLMKLVINPKAATSNVAFPTGIGGRGIYNLGRAAGYTPANLTTSTLLNSLIPNNSSGSSADLR